MTPWDLDLIGETLRKEFEGFLVDYRKKRDEVTGGRERIREADVLKRFMLLKRINLVDDAESGGLKSMFILRQDEEKTLDDRAKQNLAGRFEKIRKKTGNVESDWLGFMEFEQVGGEREKMMKPLEVEGDDVEYFVKKKTVTVEVKPKEKEKFICEVCGKICKNKGGLYGHMRKHKKT